MSTPNRLFDDFARFVTDATGAAQGVRREIETAVKTQVERFLRDMDVATREEVEVLRDMVVTARAENERLAARLDALEGGTKASAAAPATPPVGEAVTDAGAPTPTPSAGRRRGATPPGN